jgi:hypothetical protein
MKIAKSPGLPAKILLGYLGMLLATVAALMPWPFCPPLIALLYLLLTLFFLFALVVISLSFVVIFQVVRGTLTAGSGGSSSKKSGRFRPPRGARMVGQKSDLWDHWLDGASSESGRSPTRSGTRWHPWTSAHSRNRTRPT